MFKQRLFGCGVLLLTVAGCSGDGASTPLGVPVNGFQVSGSVFVPANTATDTDVNNTEATFVANDRQTQAIANPVLVGGYVNQPNQGRAGRSALAGDAVDSYQVDLRTGEQVLLFMAETDLNNNDLDLLLLNTNGQLVNTATNRSQIESLVAPANGRYVVQIQAVKGASNYVLSIGQASRLQSAGVHLSDAFVPGEITVNFKQGIFSSQALSALSALGMMQVAGEPERRMLFKLNELQAFSAFDLDAQTMQFQDAEQKRKYATLLAVKALQERADVESAAPNFILSATAVPNDPLYRYQWHYPQIKLPQAWDITPGSSNVIVAVIDTGVLLGHPDLQGKLVSGYDFIRDRAVALDGDGIDANPDDPGDAPGMANGSSFHGTHVAGTIGALTNNRDGVAGIGWNTQIMPLRVLGKGGNGSDYDIEQAVRFAAGLRNDSGTVPKQRADILNLSLGGPSVIASFQGVLTQARQQGCFIVAAAGNDGNSTVNYPGGLEGVISVAAVGINRQRASYSNQNNTVDITAPGGNNQDVNGDGVIDAVVSTIGDDSSGSIRNVFAPSFGTSMATPHVAGVLSLMKAVNPSLTPVQVDYLLSNGRMTQDLGTQGKDSSFGYGLLDAYASVVAAGELQGGNGAVPAPAAQLQVLPGALNFGSATRQDQRNLLLNISNVGGGTVKLTQIQEDSGGHLALKAVATDANGLGSYALTLSATAQEPGSYSATLRFISTVNTVDVPVIWQVTQSTLSGNAGYQYVLLVNPDTLDSVLEDRLKPLNGTYSYRFYNVPPGEYLLITGSDNDNDGFICDAGESCGAYPLLSRPARLKVDRQLDGVNFDVNFNTRFLSAASIQSVGSSESFAEPEQGFKRPTAAKRLGR